MNITIGQLILYTFLTVFMGMNIGVSLIKEKSAIPYMFSIFIVVIGFYSIVN